MYQKADHRAEDVREVLLARTFLGTDCYDVDQRYFNSGHYICIKIKGNIFSRESIYALNIRITND